LGLNYPNKADLIKSTASNPGGDIFIHGSCVTIGCIPMTNEKIKEIYLYAVYAKNNGQEKIPVYVYPFRMTDANMKKFSAEYGNTPVFSFWKNIKTGYDAFEKEQKELNVTVDRKGNYLF
jgi:murein L,D-transpeptidase YafK